MRHLDLADLVAIAVEVSEVEAPKLLELLDTAAIHAVLAAGQRPLAPHQAAAGVLVGVVRAGPLPAASRRLGLLAALQLLAANGLDADLDPAVTREVLSAVAAGRGDVASVTTWLDPRVTARDPLEGELRALLAADAWRAIGLAVLGSYRHGRRLATPADLLMGLLREGTGPAAVALGSAGPGRQPLAHPPRPQIPERLPAFEPQTRKVLELAFRASVTLGHQEINGGHLLLGLLDGGHAGVLADDLDPDAVRGTVLELLGPASPGEGVPADDLAARLGRLAARLRTTDVAAARELEEVADLQRIGLDRLIETVRAWRGDVFLEALAGDDAVVRLVGAGRLGAGASRVLEERLLAKYRTDIERYPVLTRAEEAALAATMREGPEDEAAASRRRLIESNLRLVVSVARKLAIPGLSMLDRIQEGNLGLLRAAERYDPSKGFRFTTYATWWIREAMLEATPRQP